MHKIFSYFYYIKLKINSHEMILDLLIIKCNFIIAEVLITLNLKY